MIPDVNVVTALDLESPRERERERERVGHRETTVTGFSTMLMLQIARNNANGTANANRGPQYGPWHGLAEKLSEISLINVILGCYPVFSYRS